MFSSVLNVGGGCAAALLCLKIGVYLHKSTLYGEGVVLLYGVLNGRGVPLLVKQSGAVP